MNSYLVYRASFYLMLTVSTIASNSEGSAAMAYPWAVGAAGVLAFYSVDRHAFWALDRSLANFLAAVSIPVLYFEYQFNDNELMPALGHWLVHLQLIKYFLPKTDEDDWFLFLLGLTQVLIGAVGNQGNWVGVWLFSWAMLAIWVLAQFFLQREASRFLVGRGRAETEGPRPRGPDPYSGLFRPQYYVMTLWMLIATLALGGLIFLVLPRYAGATRAQSAPATARHLTGFGEEVQLGQLGEILENDSIVMTVAFTDGADLPVSPPADPLWRGITLNRYEKGRWHRAQHRGTHDYSALPEGAKSPPSLHQKIKLEGNDSTTLFAIRPIQDLDFGRRASGSFSPVDGTFRRDRTSASSYDYDVISGTDPDGPQVGEEPPSWGSEDMLLAVPEALKAHLLRIIGPVLARQKPIPGPLLTERPAHMTAAERQRYERFAHMTAAERRAYKRDRKDAIVANAHALESYLRDSGQFTYSLHMDVVDPSLDPVEDFLVNRREGHCEYFASALALMLRSIGVPTRIVNGFKGGDWNTLTQTMNVRQKHAHSWVEAYLGVEERNTSAGRETRTIWLSLDPTPGAERMRSIARVGGLAGKFRSFTDLVRYGWVFYILGYDRDRQDRLIYGPMRELISWARENYHEAVARSRKGLSVLFHFQDVGAFISWRGGVVSFLVLSVAAILGRLALLGARRLLRWLRGPTVDDRARAAGALFYHRLAQLLARLALERAPAETQGEFAIRAGKHLDGRGAPGPPLADVPREVVEAFYRVRFGHLELDAGSLARLDARLDALEAGLDQPD